MCDTYIISDTITNNDCNLFRMKQIYSTIFIIEVDYVMLIV